MADVTERPQQQGESSPWDTAVVYNMYRNMYDGLIRSSMALFGVSERLKA